MISMNHTKAFQFCADQYKKDWGSICKLESHLIHDHVNDIEIVMCHAIRIYKKMFGKFASNKFHCLVMITIAI